MRISITSVFHLLWEVAVAWAVRLCLPGSVFAAIGASGMSLLSTDVARSDCED